MINKKGFSLIELLIVVAIIAILAGVGFVLYINVTKKGRDAARLSDLSNLHQAITAATHDSKNLSVDLCSNVASPCTGSSHPQDSVTRTTDGQGWVKINFDSSSEVNLENLPIDPINNATYNYVYYSDGTYWRVTARLESEDYIETMANDGGKDPDRFEVGVKLKLLP